MILSVLALVYLKLIWVWLTIGNKQLIVWTSCPEFSLSTKALLSSRNITPQCTTYRHCFPILEDISLISDSDVLLFLLQNIVARFIFSFITAFVSAPLQTVFIFWENDIYRGWSVTVDAWCFISNQGFQFYAFHDLKNNKINMKKNFPLWSLFAFYFFCAIVFTNHLTFWC